MELKGKNAIVTGVSRGIGKACVLALLERGVKVAGFGMRAPDYSHANFRFIATDVRDHLKVEASFQKAMEFLGNELHILVNNAGLGYFGYMEDTTVEQWKELFETNVNGIFYCCRLALPGMKKQQYGHIINIASTAALEGMAQVSAYCGTKWAVKGISESLYKELRDFKIKVTCICPGSVQTDFFRNSPSVQPHSYMLQPEDVASTILHALEMPDNFHHVNIEVRPLQPKGPK
jgi:NADP-dependent 3-hydroxy acid dehydrogenase YdfG